MTSRSDQLARYWPTEKALAALGHAYVLPDGRRWVLPPRSPSVGRQRPDLGPAHNPRSDEDRPNTADAIPCRPPALRPTDGPPR